MTKERFWFVIDKGKLDYVQDNVSKEKITVSELEDLLNEQAEKIKEIETENEQLRQFINKGRRLSVKELMNNINENELLKKKIKEIETENEQLRRELDCFHPVMFQDMRKGTVVLYLKELK